MKLSQTNGMKHVTNSDSRNQRLRTLLLMYSKDIQMAKLILGCDHIDSSKVSLELRSIAATVHLRRAIKKLRALGFDESRSSGHLIYIKTVDALAELEDAISELALQKCLMQLDRRICPGLYGNLIYYDRFVP